MKKIITILSALLVTFTAFAQKNITIFTAADDIARPITIKTNSGNYKLYNELQIDKHISWFEAYDGNGNKIMQPGASRDIHFSTEDESRLVKKYHFTTLYPSSSKSRSFSSGSKSSAGKKTHGREEYIPNYEGDYSSAYYSNLEEYLVWRLSAPPAAKAITNPEQYCGKWGSEFELNRIDPDAWSVDISWDGSIFHFDFRSSNFELFMQETENCWLFRLESYTDKMPEMRKRNLSYFYDDCDSDADPGFPRGGTYKYDEYYQNSFYRLCLQGGAVKFGAVLGHTDYYFHDVHTYSETYQFDNLSKKDLLATYIKYTPYKERPCNAREHEAVDLGLSVLWATCNIGANTPEEKGDYFAWGETGYKFFCDWESLKYCTSKTGKSFSRYNGRDGRTRLSQEDDVASVVWGKGWRMPTEEEVKELVEKCEWVKSNENGIWGSKVIGPNGNAIFLPWAGFKNEEGDLLRDNSRGLYWTSSLLVDDVCDAAMILYIDDYEQRAAANYKNPGFSIRPVIDRSNVK